MSRDPGGRRGAQAPLSGRSRSPVLFLLASIVGSVVFVAAYRAGAVQWQGIGIGIALAGFGLGLSLWSHRLMPQDEQVEARSTTTPPPEEGEAARTVVGGWQAIGRRTALGRLVLAAAGALGVAVIWPFQSLGPPPGTKLRTTGWGPGVRLVTEDGEPVRVDDLPEGGVLTVFPEGMSRRADDQVVLVRVDPADNRPEPARESWSPEGYLAYSKVCTHAGCPVGLYQTTSATLLCPCHQASFDVLHAARPVFGPSPRPLPQLPLRVDDGILVADGELSAPPGPARWSLPDESGPA